MTNKFFIILYAIVFLTFSDYLALADESFSSQVIEKAKGGVVSISNNIIKSAYGDTLQKTGTGFIVNKKRGLIITNSHMGDISDVNDIYITYFNGREAKANVIYTDP